MSTVYTIPVDAGAVLSAKETLPPGGVVEAGTPTVVLAHGWTINRQSWQPVIDEIHAHRAVRVVSYDQRGHGRSTLGSQDPTIRQLGHDLHAVIEATVPTGPIVLAGHSMGGMSIMAYAGQHHEEFRERVRGVVLVSTAASIEDRKAIPLEGLVMRVCAAAPGIQPRVLVPTWAQRGMIFGQGARKEDVKHAIRQVQRTKMPTIGKYFNALSMHNELESLAHFVDVPTHILVGGEDRLTPVDRSRQLAEAIPDARLTVLAGLGHMLTYEAREIVSDALIEMVDNAREVSAA